MPSALSNHVSSMPDTPTSTSSSTARERNPESIVERMDGVVRKAGEVVTGAATRDRAVHQPDQPVAKPELEDQHDHDDHHHVHKPQPHRHSLDYVLRSFVAGGVAGCAVRTLFLSLPEVRYIYVIACHD